MPSLMISKPDAAEYMPYYEKYIALVPDGDVMAALRQQLDDTLALLSGVDEARGAHRYAPDKWSVKELVGHVIDTERIFAYRALRFARKDETPLSGFGAEIAARIADELFEFLDAPVRRVAALDTFVAYAPRVEDHILPQVEDVARAITELYAY